MQTCYNFLVNHTDVEEPMELWIRELFDESVLKSAGIVFGAMPDTIVSIGGFENFIYGFPKDGIDVILRISHSSHRTKDDTMAELDFVRYLAQHGACVSEPIPSIHGNLVETIPAKDGSYFTASAYVKAQGERPNRNHQSPEFFFHYGKTIGEFHRLGRDYQPDPSLKRRFDWDQDPLLVHAREYLDDQDEVIYSRFKETMESIRKLKKTKDNYFLIHTDVHMGNFFVKDNRLTVFDFDDCSTMHIVSDIAIALFYYIVFMKATPEEKKEHADLFMTHFMKGYLSEYALRKEDYLHIPIFLKLREIILYIVLFRSTDIKTNTFARTYIETHRPSIIEGHPIIDLDFETYYIKALSNPGEIS